MMAGIVLPLVSAVLRVLRVLRVGCCRLLGGQEIDLESGLPTKVSLSDQGSGMNVYWSMNDAIEVGWVDHFFYDNTSKNTATHTKITTSGNSGSSKYAKFDGTIPIAVYSAGVSYYYFAAEAFYPATATFTTVNAEKTGVYPYPHLKTTFDLSSQVGYQQFAQNDFGNIMYAADTYKVTHTHTAPGTTAGNLNLALKFHPVTAILKINLTFNPAREFNGKVVISTVDSNNKLIVAGTLEGNPTTNQASLIATSATRGDVTINTGVVSSGTITSIPTVYVAVIGQTLNSELVITAGGMTATTTSVKGKTLEGGKVYTINKTLIAPGTPTP
jgi:hypothetical protein